MGSIFGDIFGANEQASADKSAAQQALTGFNYLTGSPTENQYVNTGGAANSAESQLLGLSPITAQTQNGFQNYLNSTGYKFNLAQGQNAITGSAAAKGLVNSGATGKALTSYGQNLASGYFNNYLGQLGGLSGQGQTALGQIGQAGTTGGGNAAGYTQNAGQAQSQGLNNAIGSALNTFGNIPFFG